MSDLQITTRYKDVAWWLRSVKLATLPQGYAPHSGHLTAQVFNGLGAPVGLGPEVAEITNQFIAYESAWHLDNFVHQLSAVIAQIHEAARLHAQRQSEEAARQMAQRQAEEAARLHAQRLAEEAARQLAQRQAEEAAQLAARQLADQQAYAAAQALAEQKAQEAALQEARLALELVPVIPEQSPEAAFNNEPSSSETALTNSSLAEIAFMPGPAAMAEIDRATLALKQSIDAAVIQYASAISPYLNSPAPGTHAIQ
jgi:flagellar biosynthesis GTPase FlhF